MNEKVRYAVLCLTAVLLAGCLEQAGPDFSSPDSSVIAVSQAMADHRPEVGWDAMPASYQEDATSLLHEAAARIDPDTWNRGFGIFQKIVAIARDQREFILNSAMLAATPGAEEIRRNWDSATESMAVLADSELADLETLRSLDIREFLAGTGHRFLKSFSELTPPGDPQEQGQNIGEKLDELTVTVLEQEENRARLEITIPGEPPQRQTYLKIEDRWVPENIAVRWDKTVADAREKIARITPENSKLTPALEQAMGTIEGVLDRLAAAETQAEFDTALQQVSGVLMGLILMGSMS